MRRLLLGVIAALLAGCLSKSLDLNFGGDSARMTPEHAQFIKKAGVVSVIEQHARTQFVASSLKESNHETLVLRDFHPRKFTTEVLEARLRQMGFTVVPIEANISLADAYSSSGSFADPGRVRTQLIAIGQQHRVDMLVVAYRQMVRDFVDDSSQRVIGFGLYKRHSSETPYAYAAVHIEALNINKDYVMGKANGTTKIALDGSAWRREFETDASPLHLGTDGLGTGEKIKKALRDATIIAAQEAGVSN